MNNENNKNSEIGKIVWVLIIGSVYSYEITERFVVGGDVYYTLVPSEPCPYVDRRKITNKAYMFHDTKLSCINNAINYYCQELKRYKGDESNFGKMVREKAPKFIKNLKHLKAEEEAKNVMV